ncbi:MAG: hypothetical protein ACRDTG_26080 [Pseudonocardiaceae bacterium]
MTGAALVLSMVDTCTEELHFVLVEAVALHRRSGCYPALCGPSCLRPVFRRLADTEMTELLDSSFPGGLHRVVITLGGQSRYQELSAVAGGAR